MLAPRPKPSLALSRSFVRIAPPLLAAALTGCATSPSPVTLEAPANLDAQLRSVAFLPAATPVSTGAPASDENLISAFGEAAFAAAAGIDDDEAQDLDLDLDNLLIEVSFTPRDGDANDIWGASVYAYPDAGWGAGLQIQGTLIRTGPEVGVVLVPPSAELEPRTTEVTVDVVATYRLAQGLGVFAGVGVATIEEFRRFQDAIGNDFFVSEDEDLRGNFTAGAHLWLTEWLTISAQWDSVFDATAFGVGINL